MDGYSVCVALSVLSLEQFGPFYTLFSGCLSIQVDQATPKTVTKAPTP